MEMPLICHGHQHLADNRAIAGIACGKLRLMLNAHDRSIQGEIMPSCQHFTTLIATLALGMIFPIKDLNEFLGTFEII